MPARKVTLQRAQNRTSAQAVRKVEAVPRAPLTRLQFLTLAGVLLTAHLYFANEFRAFPNPNVRSRIYLTLAVVDHGKLAIDDCVQRFGSTMDMAQFTHTGENGVSQRHFYTDKAPGYSMVLVPLAWLLRHTIVSYDDIRTMSILLRVFGLSLPAVAFWLLTFRHWSSLAGDERRGAAIVLAGALGTNFFIYSTQLFAHAAAGMLIFAAYLIGMRRGGLWQAAACGALVAIAFTFDYMVLPAILLIPIFVIINSRGRRFFAAAALVAAALPVAIGWMAYNRACFGNPFDVGFRHHVDPTYGPAYQRGLWGMQSPNPAAILGMTVLPARGIFWISPFLLLAPVGWRRMFRNPEQRPRAVASTLTTLSISFFAMTTVDWRGGWSVSVRYLVPALPFVLEGVAAALTTAWTAPFFISAALLGVAQTALGAATFPDFPNEFHDPYYDMAIPLLRGGHVNGTVWHSAATIVEMIPFAILILAVLAWLVRLLAAAATRRGITAAVVIAMLLGAAQAACGARLDYLRTHVLSDVLGKMGYTCDGDALRVALHEAAIKVAHPPPYDLSQLAVLRAASPCDHLRDPQQAIALAQQAVQITREKRWESYAAGAWDSLAIAQANAGNFDGAQAAGRRAVELARKSSDRSVMVARLNMYAHHRAYRRAMSPR